MLASFFVWLKENTSRLFLLLGIFLVGILCFEAGLIQGKMKQGEPLVITLPSIPSEVLSEGEAEKQEGGVNVESTKMNLSNVEPVVSRVNTGNCTFVGSKNSNKYHLASCAVAKRIKPENRICFTTQEEARARGYIPSCLK